MSEETTGDRSGVLKGRNAAPPPGGGLGHTIHDLWSRSLPPADDLNRCGQASAFAFARARSPEASSVQQLITITNRPAEWAALNWKCQAAGPRPRESVGSCLMG